MKIKNSFIVALLSIMLFLPGCVNPTAANTPTATNTTTFANINTKAITSTVNPTGSGILTVNFIDVGQGDSELIQLPNSQNMLIDSGPNDAGSTVADYLSTQGVKRIDYLVTTHPHEDHIGNMDRIVEKFDIGQVYMPKAISTTKTYENLLNAIQKKGLKITAGRAGMTILDKDGLKISFLAPCGSKYEDLNNWSIVTKVQFGNTSFLFEGDAEELSEEQMIKSGANIKADVLKIAHHGSQSSTGVSALKAISPKYAVISVGKGNDYGHPHQVTLDKLAAAGVKVYRTDQNGTIIMTSDGKNITVKAAVKSTSTAAVSPQNTSSSATVETPAVMSNTGVGSFIGNKNSKIFHLASCKSLPALKNRIYFSTREEAIKGGYTPCSMCRP